MNRSVRLCLLSSATYFALTGLAFAGNVTAQGAVTALTDVNQLQGVIGTATYNEGGNGVPLNQYTPQGMTFYTGLLTQILPGVVTGGSASQPIYQVNGNYFPGMIGGGGVATGAFTFFGGAVKFSQPTTQLGLTASTNGTQYLTVWDTNGVMIGQVTWQPANDAAFIGIDTNGVPIGMATFGNDNLWGGGSYDIGGSTIISDTWIWAAGTPCQADDECMDDGNPCTDAPICQGGACLQAPLNNVPCTDDNDICTDDVCTNGVCSHPDNTDPCDDGNACTDNDVCGSGDCQGDDISCGDANLCTIDDCDPDIGCTYDMTPGCCTSDEDCEVGYICLLGSNSCIVDPDPTGDGEGDGDGDGDGDPTTGDGDGDPTTTGDGDGDPTTGDGDGDGDGDPTGGNEGTDGEGESDTGGETGDPFDTFGTVEDDSGCSCTTDERGAGALFGLFGLALLGAVRRRRDGDL